MSITTQAPAAPARPTRTDVQPFGAAIKDPKSNIFALIQHPEMQARMRQALPRHLSPERMLRVVSMALQKTPKLAECNRMSLLGCMLACGSLGLEPNTVLGHAYLIPFKDQCTLIVGYKGLVDLARRSGHISTIHCDVVYAGDEFDFEYGSSGRLRHVPAGQRKGDWLYAYAFARMVGGGEQYEVMTRAEVLAIRDKSQGYLRDKAKSPWTLYEPEMAKKTALRRMAKWLPLSIEFANAAALDELSDAGRADLAAMATGDISLDAITYDDGPGGGEGDGKPVLTQSEVKTNTPGPVEQPAAKAPDSAPQEAEPAEPTQDGPLTLDVLLAGLDASNSADELKGYWRDIEEARSGLSHADRAKLNTRRAEIEVQFLNKGKR